MRERTNRQLTHFMGRACQPVAERDLFAPTRLRAGGLLEEAATLLVTILIRCASVRGGSVPLGRAHTHLCSACGAGLRIATVRAMSITF